MTLFKLRQFSLSTYIGVFLIALCAFITWASLSTPSDFPKNTRFTVNEDESLYTISNRLKDEGIITSSSLFRAWISFMGKDRHIQLGVYTFDEPYTLGRVVTKFVSGVADEPLARITIPEGSTTTEIIDIVRKAVPSISPQLFNQAVAQRDGNGKLFPSTYYILPSSTEDRIVELLTKTFETKYKDGFDETKYPPHVRTQEEVIILASILEGEANTEKDMRLVSGILQKRLAIGMALQVDVALETYKVRGLPKEPINNPGLMALGAVFNSEPSEYLYYLTGNDGTMHYAKTFEEHKRNIQNYLR